MGGKRKAAAQPPSSPPPQKRSKNPDPTRPATTSTPTKSTKTHLSAPQNAPDSPATPTKKGMKATDAQIQRNLRNAMENNPTGVRVAVESLEANLGSLAGYLGFEDTMALKSYLNHDAASLSPIATALRAFHQSRDNKFGMTIERRTWVSKRIFELAFDPDSASWFGQMPVPATIVGDERGYRTWVITMDRIIRASPTSFPGEPDPHNERTYTGLDGEKVDVKKNEHTPEDWSRAYWIVKASIRQSSRATGGSTRARKEAAEPPLALSVEQEETREFARDDLAGDPSGPLTSADNKVTAERLSLIAGDDEILPNPDAFDDEAYKALEDTAELATASTSSTLRESNKKNIRPSMTASEQAAICNQLGAQVKVIWPEGDLVPTTEQIDTDTALCMSEPSSDVHRTQLLMQSTVDDSSARRADLELQSQLNAVSATPPTYLASCEMLNLRPEKPILAILPGTHIPSRLTSMVRELKPWQVQFLAWAARVETSPLRSWLLADDMGLGKTMSALARLLVYTRDQQVQFDATKQAADKGDDNTTDNKDANQKAGAEGGDGIQTNGDALRGDGGKKATSEVEPELHNNGKKPVGNDDHPREEEGIGGIEGESLLPEDDKGRSTRYGKQPSASDHPALHQLAEAQRLTDSIACRRHKATLILAPAQATNVWKQEISRHFPELQPHYFFNSPARTTSVSDKAKTLGTSIVHLLRFLHSLPDDPSVGLSPIISSYTTWACRALYHSSGSSEARAARMNRPVGEEDDNIADDPGDRELTEEELVSIRLYCPGVFFRVICDEGQKLKNPRTQTTHAVHSLRATVLNILTATPIINRPVDLLGPLQLLWKSEFDRPPTPRASDDGDDEAESHDGRSVGESLQVGDYLAAKTKLQACGGLLSADDMVEFLHFLNPTSFRTHMLPSTGATLSPHVANAVLPVILTLLQLRRTTATTIELGLPGRTSITVGEEIPPARWTYIELQGTPDTLKAYHTVHRICAGSLGGGVDEDQNNLLNMTTHRRLCQATSSPDLDQFFIKAKRATSAIDSYYHKGNDHGATYYFHVTRPHRSLPAYDARPSMALYIARFAPKLQLLAKMAHQMCNVNGRKLLIFCDWPLVQWNVEMTLANLGFNVTGIRAVHKNDDRDAAVNQFNDPTSNLQILVTSLRISATAINLQESCSDLIFVDCPSNSQTALQAAGRVLRIGQKRMCRVYVLTMDHSYDQTLQQRATTKMINIISGQGSVRVTDDDRSAWRQANSIEATSLLEQDQEDQLSHNVLTLKCAHLYKRMFGQRSSRHRPEWAYTGDVTLKDRLPEESEFRQAKKLSTSIHIKTPLDTKGDIKKAPVFDDIIPNEHRLARFLGLDRASPQRLLAPPSGYMKQANVPPESPPVSPLTPPQELAHRSA